jgi:hypothetical protein
VKLSNRFAALSGARRALFCLAAALGLAAPFSTEAASGITISGTPPTQATVGQTYNFAPTAKDLNGRNMYFWVVNKPSWLRVSGANGHMTGTPTASNIGTTSNIQLWAGDGKSYAELKPFSITVASAGGGTTPPPPPPPTISGTPPTTVAAGTAYSFTPTASDSNGKALQFSIQNPPSWATFSTATGTLSGTPTAAQAGTYANIIIGASDGTSVTKLPAFSITVTTSTTATPLTISGSPATTATAGSLYSFTPTATDAKGKTLTFSIANMPAWTSFSSSTGKLSGTPTVAQDGTYSNITITVSDGTSVATLPAFSITASASTSATPPKISGTPATTATAGTAYSFTPNASDSNGKPLQFGILNQPSWANFSSTTGQLSGTPTAAQVGTYANITIAVTDQVSVSMLPVFSIAVSAAGSGGGSGGGGGGGGGGTTPTGTATINWAAPTTNNDGSALTNLAGFQIAYGTSASALTQTVQVASPSTTSFTVSNLASGTWYFAVQAYTNTGAMSALSNPASKTVQ